MAILPRASASEWNEKTVFTFNSAVEIPGRVLSPGTYVFKLMDSQSNRNIVEVLNKKENHVYGMFLAIPDYRMKPSGKPIVTFEERAAGAPQAVKAWFYPGDNYGHDFVYPKAKAAELAQANKQAVPSVSNETMAATNESASNESQMQNMKQAPMQAQNPSGSESEVAEAFPAPANTQNQSAQNQASNESSANRSENLPKTASNLPLIGVLGLLSLAGAGLLLGAERALKATK
ncbi:MAG TPA: hypothetical protein VHW09_29470 [Bryobacteraceae bacterium]|nr:hypothetical protein [Bryobacteraceae bacterium]